MHIHCSYAVCTGKGRWILKNVFHRQIIVRDGEVVMGTTMVVKRITMVVMGTIMVVKRITVVVVRNTMATMRTIVE